MFGLRFHPSQFLTRFARTSRSGESRRRVHLSLATLEERLNPVFDVNVTAVLSGSVLTLTGVNSAIAAANPQTIRIADDGVSGISVTGLKNVANSTTEINGGKVPVNFLGVKSLSINMGLGDDQVFLDKLNLPGAVTINGGSSSGKGNLVQLGGGGSFGSISVTNADGFDEFEIGNGGGVSYTIAGHSRSTMGLADSRAAA